MNALQHPAAALYAGEPQFPALTACEHFAGSLKLMEKALSLQAEMGPVFDITCDCEDGAPAGAEAEHAQMVAEVIAGSANRFGLVGARLHDYSHAHWRRDAEIILAGCASQVAYLTLPKVTSVAQASEMIGFIRNVEDHLDNQRAVPIHILIETHGGLREAFQIAALPGVETLDFGLLDFISDHHGAIPSSAMTSPGQFTHALVARAKTEVSAAALANGVVPSHNVTTELRDRDTIYQDARRAHLEFGYLRMYSIHPAQIEPIVAAMQPEHRDVADAVEILVEAQAAGWGPTRHRGKLHDRASYRFYWQVLQSAHVTGMELPEQAKGFFA